MKIAKELPNVETLRHLGTTALHLIATLPEEEKEEQIQRIEDGDTPTVRELQEVKNKLKLSKLANKRLQAENREDQVFQGRSQGNHQRKSSRTITKPHGT